jgi:hypothetical protein
MVHGGNDVHGSNPPPAPEVLAEIKTVADKAERGDVSVLPRLRELLAQYPALWRHYGDLAAQAEMAWVTRAAGPDLYLRECLLQQAAALRAELAGPTPSPIERLLVERAVACWLQLQYFSAAEAQVHGESPKLTMYRARRHEQAQRMYLTALAAMTTLRRLLAANAAMILPPGKTDSAAGRNGHQRNGFAPHDARNRISEHFEEQASAGI